MAQTFHLSFVRGRQLSGEEDPFSHWELSDGVQLYAERDAKNLRVGISKVGIHPFYIQEQTFDRASFYFGPKSRPTMSREWYDRRWQASLYWEFANTAPGSLPSWFQIISHQTKAIISIKCDTSAEPHADQDPPQRKFSFEVEVIKDGDLEEIPIVHKLTCMQSDRRKDPTLLIKDEGFTLIPRMRDSDYQSFVVPILPYPGLEDPEENATEALRRVSAVTIPLLMHFHDKQFQQEILIAGGMGLLK